MIVYDSFSSIHTEVINQVMSRYPRIQNMCTANPKSNRYDLGQPTIPPKSVAQSAQSLGHSRLCMGSGLAMQPLEHCRPVLRQRATASCSHIEGEATRCGAVAQHCLCNHCSYILPGNAARSALLLQVWRPHEQRCRGEQCPEVMQSHQMHGSGSHIYHRRGRVEGKETVCTRDVLPKQV